MTPAYYIASHQHEARRFGVTPLPSYKLREMLRQGRTLSDAYSVACDKAAGFTYAQALEALDRQR
jgi:hypothetical protein